VVTQFAHSPVLGYLIVFGIEAAMLVASLWLLRRIDVSAFRQREEEPSLLERAALAAD
jgi:hypothetical protein